MTIAIDFETYRICEEAPWPKPVCLSYCCEKTHATGLAIGRGQIAESLTGIFQSDLTIITHNAQFEVGVIYTHFPEFRSKLFQFLRENKIVCTKIYQQLIDHTQKNPYKKYALSDLVKLYFNEDISESKKNPNAWRLNYHKLDGVPLKQWPQEAVDYATQDSVWALKLYNKQKRHNMCYGESVRAEALLNIMGKDGILVDKKRVQVLENELYAHLKPSYNLLLEKGFGIRKLGTDVIKKETKKLKAHIKEVVPKHLWRYTKKQSISTSGEDLMSYGEDPIIKAFSQIAQYEKILTGFVSNLKKANPKIRTSYSATKSTGRTSSTKDSNMPSVNIQNMPRSVDNVTYDVRNCFIPREGFSIVPIDYSGLELTTAANQLYRFYGHSKLLDLINKGDTPMDLHSNFATKVKTMAGEPCTYEEFVKNKKKPGWKEYRQLCKGPHLSFPGGVGADTLRVLLAKEGIYPKFQILERAKDRKTLETKLFILRQEFDNVRISRLGKNEYALVGDELQRLKNIIYQMYPELARFLTKGHKKFQRTDVRYLKDDFGDWKEEAMYRYDIYGMRRDWCTYTAFCNGYLMQTPSAIGAKRMISNLIEKYADNIDVYPLAFIHDEAVLEIRECPKQPDYIREASEIMIDSMRTVTPFPRITVEAERMNYWRKAGGDWSCTYFKNPGENTLRTC